MGTTKTALIGVAALWTLLLLRSHAQADPCVRYTRAHSPFATCFDAGNRLFLAGGSDGFGAGLRVRHGMGFDDAPDLTWKLEHHVLEAKVGGMSERYSGLIYSGRYLRHARDGHIVVPLGTPRKIFVPFDIGAEGQLGSFRQTRAGEALEIGVVRVAGLFDFSRTATFRRRIAIGIVASWDMRLDLDSRRPSENLVAPLSLAHLSGYSESKDGLTLGSLECTAGREWSSSKGWRWRSSARASVERVLLALNDHPLSMVIEASASTPERELRATLGARFSLFTSDRTLPSPH